MRTDSLTDYIAKVGTALASITGGAITDTLDLPDYDYAGCWDDGLSPRTAAKFALEAEGWEG